MEKEPIRKRRDHLLRGLHSDNELFALDEEADLDSYEYNSPGQKFDLLMRNQKITVAGEYAGCDTQVKLKCDKCSNEWSAVPTKAIAHGCPKCRKETINVQADIKLYERSTAIIRDKGGKVIKLSAFNPAVKSTIDNRFLVICHKGHRFTTTHRFLRRNRWCPLCKANSPYHENPVSKAVYGNKTTEQGRQKRIIEVCSIKGVKLSSVKQGDGTFELTCNNCGSVFQKNPLQILKNVYLCPFKCIKGEKFTYKAAGEW